MSGVSRKRHLERIGHDSVIDEVIERSKRVSRQQEMAVHGSQQTLVLGVAIILVAVLFLGTVYLALGG